MIYHNNLKELITINHVSIDYNQLMWILLVFLIVAVIFYKLKIKYFIVKIQILIFILYFLFLVLILLRYTFDMNVKYQFILLYSFFLTLFVNLLLKFENLRI